MNPDNSLSSIAHVIQLSIAPVFLLTGVASMLVVLTNRLGRIIDRTRSLENQINAQLKETPKKIQKEMAILASRMHLINWAISLCTICALLVCILIATLFIGTFWKMDVARFIVFLFVVAMLSLIGGLLSFLREIFKATHATRRGMH